MSDQVFWLFKLYLEASLHRVTLMFYWYVINFWKNTFYGWATLIFRFVFQVQGNEYTSLVAQCRDQSDEEFTQTNTSVSERFCKVKY